MIVRKSASSTVLLSTLLLAPMAGCSTLVPIHVWSPSGLESTVGKRVVISDVVGPKDITSPLKQKLIASAPQDSGRETTIASSLDLHQSDAIRLVSATDEEPSDIALSAAAKQEGYDYVLRGEVLEDRRPKELKEADKRLSISWRLFQLGDDSSTGGMPVVVAKDTAIDRYPDLKLIADEDTLLMTAAVRDTYRLISPSVNRHEIRLAIPYATPGSKRVRAGNIAALNGRWADAKRIWSEVAETHKLQVAAIHNLALAAVAEQDFSKAKQLARKAVRRKPSSLHQKTLVWIELQQREYHKAFNLPDPPEGWFVTQ